MHKLHHHDKYCLHVLRKQNQILYSVADHDHPARFSTQGSTLPEMPGVSLGASMW
ncbi:hypothetical protein Mapa_016584 [Marchantia paleacea]|nr:hypothetical protein Mapa_016584 [Marchantia paleacea]